MIPSYSLTELSCVQRQALAYVRALAETRNCADERDINHFGPHRADSPCQPRLRREK